MKKYSLLIMSCMALICFSCSSKKAKMAQVMIMGGSIMEVGNPNDVDFSRGDSIVLRNYCNHKDPCQTSIYGYYKGTLLKDDLRWKNGIEGGELEASYTYEKAVFLKDIKD